jgi:hypothetical protein
MMIGNHQVTYSENQLRERRKLMTRESFSQQKGIHSVNYVLTGLLILLFSMLSAGLLLPGATMAEEGYGPGTDKWKFELGAFFPSINTELKIDGLDPGDDLDLEDDLGFSDDDTLWRLDGYWRFFKRHRLHFGYYGFNRDASVTLDEEIEIGDEVFPIGAKVNSDLKLGFYSFDYMYSYFQGEKWELSAGLGAYWVDFEFSAAGRLELGDEEFEEFYESTDFNGPLPYLKLAFEYYITPKWLAIIKGGYFQLSVGDIDGRLTNLGAKTEYQFTKRWGLGLGYDAFRIDVTIDDEELKSDIEYNYHGIQAYGILRF